MKSAGVGTEALAAQHRDAAKRGSIAPGVKPGASLARITGEVRIEVKTTAVVDGDDLVFARLPAGAAVRSIRVERSALDRFSRLAGRRPNAYLDFAQKFGPLGLCRCGRLYRHLLGAERPGYRCGSTIDGLNDEAWDAELNGDDPSDWFVHREPLRGWMAYARLAGALVRSTTRAAAGLLPDRDDLHAMQHFHPEHDAVPVPYDGGLLLSAVAVNVKDLPVEAILPSEVRHLVARLADEWIREGGGRPVARWSADRERPELSWASDTLGGFLGVQLALNLANETGLVPCSGAGCREFFVPKRGNARYCPACDNETDRARERKRKQRLREAVARGAADDNS